MNPHNRTTLDHTDKTFVLAGLMCLVALTLGLCLGYQIRLGEEMSAKVETAKKVVAERIAVAKEEGRAQGWNACQEQF